MVFKPKSGYYASHPGKSNEYYLLQLTKQRNSSQAQAAKNQLILQNEGFLKSFIQLWIEKRGYIDFNYVLSEARIAFLSAIDAYDLSKDVSIRTYARFYLLELKKQIFKKNELVELKTEHCTATSSVPNPDFKNFDLKASIIAAIESCLSNVEQEVIYMHFFKGLKQRQIAQFRCCSEARISAIIKTALPKLRAHLIDINITPWFLEWN